MITPSPMWGLAGIVLLVFLALLSMPIAAAMAIVGFILAFLFYGDINGVFLTGFTAWGGAASYTMSMLPLFVLLGETIARCGQGADAYDCFYKWMSRTKGGLGIVSTLSCALFGAITGSTAGTITTIGSVSIPQMKARGYSVPLRHGTLAVAGCLAALIPPSNVAIIYSNLSEASVGKVFMAGFVPGIILVIFFILTTHVWVTLRPSDAPRSMESFPLRERVASLKGVIPLLVIFAGMMGGIYFGVFTPTEAAGIGVAYAIAVGIIARRLSWPLFKTALLSTTRTTSFIMVLMMGAMIFAHSMAISQLPQFLADTVMGLNVSPTVLIFALIGVFIVLGCVMDVMGLLVILVPLFYPVVVALGFDVIWFGTLVVVLAELSLITPPVAIHLYISQSLDPEASAVDVCRGIMPYYLSVVALVILLVFFPQIALWLPSLMYK